MLFDIFNNFKKKFYNFNVFKITSINYLTKKYFGLFIKIVNTFITYYKNDKKNIPNEFNIELWNLLITYYNNNKIYDIKCFENFLQEDDMKTCNQFLNTPNWLFGNKSDIFDKTSIKFWHLNLDENDFFSIYLKYKMFIN